MVKIKIIILLILLLIMLMNLTGEDMSFGVFNYKGYRLKKITRWFGEKKTLVDQMEYKYDDKGYLSSREYYGFTNKGNKRIVYRSILEYDLSNNIIIEKFDRFLDGSDLKPVFLEYIYDKDKKLINYKRKGENKYNKINISRDVDIKYNEKGDIVYIFDNQKTSKDDAFFPGEGFFEGFVNEPSIFKYEYNENIKIIYLKLREDLDFYQGEYIYNNNRLIKFINYDDKEKNIKSYITYFTYDETGNIIETLFEFYNYNNNNVNYKEKIEYAYIGNRLIRRTWYYPDNINRNKVSQIEEYYYEDGDFVYYPYLLPDTKIKIYGISRVNDAYIDRDVF
jgi:hypothetical protein